MDQKLNEELLHKASEEILIEVKIEAEKFLESLHTTENILLSKATGLIQVLFPVFVVLVGVVIDRFSKHDIGPLFYAASLLSVVIFASSYYICNVLSLFDFTFSGCRPSKILDEDVIDGTKKEVHMQFLKGRIYSLQLAADRMLISHAKRIRFYDIGFNVLTIGTAAVFILSFLGFLYLMIFAQYLQNL